MINKIRKGGLLKAVPNNASVDNKNGTKVDVPSLKINLTLDLTGDRVIVVNYLILFGSRAPPSKNHSGARYNRLWFYLSRRVRDR